MISCWHKLTFVSSSVSYKRTAVIINIIIADFDFFSPFKLAFRCAGYFQVYLLDCSDETQGGPIRSGEASDAVAIIGHAVSGCHRCLTLPELVASYFILNLDIRRQHINYGRYYVSQISVIWSHC